MLWMEKFTISGFLILVESNGRLGRGMDLQHYWPDAIRRTRNWTQQVTYAGAINFANNLLSVDCTKLFHQRPKLLPSLPARDGKRQSKSVIIKSAWKLEIVIGLNFSFFNFRAGTAYIYAMTREGCVGAAYLKDTHIISLFFFSYSGLNRNRWP